jgi:hypothetical protein
MTLSLGGCYQGCEGIGREASKRDVQVKIAGKTRAFEATANWAIRSNGQVTRRGTKFTGKQIVSLGAFRGELVRRSTARGPAGDALASQLRLARFKEGTWHSIASGRFDIRTRKGSGQGFSLVTFKDKSAGQLCVRFAGTAESSNERGKVKVTGEFETAGGTGYAARLVASGKLRHRFGRRGSSVRGTGEARLGRARPLAAACAQLKQRYRL